jgi:hypothetical protein
MREQATLRDFDGITVHGIFVHSSRFPPVTDVVQQTTVRKEGKWGRRKKKAEGAEQLQTWVLHGHSHGVSWS